MDTSQQNAQATAEAVLEVQAELVCDSNPAQLRTICHCFPQRVYSVLKRPPVDSKRLLSDKRRAFKQLASFKFCDYLKGNTDDLKTNPKRFCSFIKSVTGRNSEVPLLVSGNDKVEDDIANADLHRHHL